MKKQENNEHERNKQTTNNGKRIKTNKLEN